MAMTSSRPYMIRALYEWIVDNDCTPHILVNAYVEGVEVPQQHIDKDGQIILNISPGSVGDLELGLDFISFNARFGGLATDIFVPTQAVLGIYARENSQGMVFEADVSTPPEPPSPSPLKPVDNGGGGSKNGSSKKRPGLRVVK